MSDRAQAKLIFLEALDNHTPEQWPAFVAQACAGDDLLRADVEKLMRAQAEIGSFHEQPRVAVTVDKPTVTERPGTVIGPYKLMEQLGEGGMGTVFMAEQTQPVQRKVALKVIKAGMDSRQVIARFEAERQALAVMDHVNIARVFDGGATESGRPYFVMELVHGVPITKYCDDNHLTPRERLELFVPVCQAIQHAHQKGIIHRDIKPSNVMVTLYDGKPVPKVIDFGVAKGTEQKLTERTLFTQYGSQVGTLEYMSPEQAEMSALGVDTRSDIYSLGVLLYELLTGSTPLTNKRMKEAAYAEILRMIKEEEPPKPSTRLSDSREALASISAQRKSEPAKLSKLMRGELDWIVMKTLEKDRNRRYDTANSFAADVQHYLNDETVQACPPSAWYRFRKFARRNKRALTMAAVVAAVVLAGTIASIGQAVRATRAEQKAVREQHVALTAQARTKFVNQFLVELIKEFAPDENPRNRLAPEVVLHKSVERMERDPTMSEQPDVEASIRFTIGCTYWKLGFLKEAESNMRRAVQLRTEFLGPDDPETLAAQEQLAWLLSSELRRYSEAEPLSRDNLQRCRRVLGPEHPTTLDAMVTYGMTLFHMEGSSEAESLLRESWETRCRLSGNENERSLMVQNNLGSVLVNQGKWADAVGILRPCLEGYRRTVGMHVEGAMSSLNNLSLALHQVGKFEEAERLLREGQEMMRQSHTAEHPGTVHLQHQLSRVLLEQQKYPEAEALCREALRVRRKILPAGHEHIARSQLVLGRILVESNRAAEAEPVLREAVTLLRERYATQKALIAEGEAWLGACLAARARYPEAEPLLLAGYEALKVHPSIPPRQRDAIRRHIIRLYESWRKPDKAAEWRAKHNEDCPLRQ